MVETVQMVGTTKEVIHQVSHSKKWASKKIPDKNGSPVRDRNGRAVLVNAYSLLQDRFYEHMKSAGFRGFERGERGSTAEHLDVLDYKIRKDTERLEGLAGEIGERQRQAAALGKSVRQTEEKLAGLDRRLAVTQKASAMFSELEAMGKKNLLGRMELMPEELKKLLALAKAGLASRGEVEDLKRQLAERTKSSDIYRTRWQELAARTKEYMEMERLHPEETHAALESLKELQTPRPEQRRVSERERRTVR